MTVNVGVKKWLALAGCVTLLDILPGETLSAAHGFSVKNKKNALIIFIIEGYVVAHLWEFVPPSYDLLRVIVKSLLKK